jgi:uncharacterized protein
MTLVGLISDTHGLLRPQAAAALAGVSHILHAGDVGKPEVLQQLAAIAPLTAVRGNVDFEDWALALPMKIAVSIAGHNIHMLHILEQLSIDPESVGVSVIVSGHTHKPHAETRGGVLFINPGSAGPRRFSLPISIGFLRLAENVPPEGWIRTLDA